MLYQALIFGCIQPRAGMAYENREQNAVIIENWMESLAKHTRVQLIWATDTAIIRSLSDEASHHGDVFGVLVALSDEYAIMHTRGLPIFDMLDEFAGTTALAELCLPLWEDIQTAMTRWEIARFSARAIDLNLPVGRIFLVQGWYKSHIHVVTSTPEESA